jgi:cold shock protein
VIQAKGAPRAPVTGTVEAFDEPRGLGAIAGDDGRRYPFHCTAIADGSRRIEAGTRVVFVAAPGHLGRIEARALSPL